jgi:uncharacterized RDD family membrane protein YckC
MAANTYETTRYALVDMETRFGAMIIDLVILSVISSLSFLITSVYFWYFLTRNNGQTPGNQLMKIRVIKMNGTPIKDSDAIIRYVGYAVNNIFFIGWAWAFFDSNRQGWHDKIAETYVVKAE